MKGKGKGLVQGGELPCIYMLCMGVILGLYRGIWQFQELCMSYMGGYTHRGIQGSGRRA